MVITFGVHVSFELLVFLTSNVKILKCHLSLFGGLITVMEYFTVAKHASIPAQTSISLNRITRESLSYGGFEAVLMNNKNIPA
jgi:hypothetical protein